MIYRVFALILIGLLVGKIKILGVRIGLASVLILSLLFGFLTTKGSNWDGILSNDICSFLSNFGTVLFIAAIGLQSGTSFEVFGKKQVKAFVCGVCIATIGFAVAAFIGLLDGNVASDLLVGLFSGSMTSTPAMSAGMELYGNESQVSLGYGMSYVVGLLSVALFVQVFRLPYIIHTADEQDSTFSSNIAPLSKEKRGNVFIWLSASILGGMTIALILPIGNTGGVLISALFFGLISRKKNLRFPDVSILKSFGLLLFFIGAGITAGRSLSGGIYWMGVLYGAAISVGAIGCGYLITHCLFQFSKVESLSIICGGMTSTPAIGVLQERNSDTDLSLYSISYIGALIVLILAVRVLGLIFS